MATAREIQTVVEPRRGEGKGMTVRGRWGAGQGQIHDLIYISVVCGRGEVLSNVLVINKRLGAASDIEAGQERVFGWCASFTRMTGGSGPERGPTEYEPPPFPSSKQVYEKMRQATTDVP